MVDTIITSLFETNTYLYQTTPNHIVVIDPGSNAKEIFNRIKDSFVTVDAILCTHGHFDHIAAVGELKNLIEDKQATPLVVAASSLDKNYFGKMALEYHKKIFSPFQLGESFFDVVPIPNIDIDLNETKQFLTFTVIKTPGHTKGSICLFDEQKNILFTGDTIFAVGEGRCDLEDGNSLKLKESILQLLQLPKECVIYPGHGMPSTINLIAKNYSLF